MTASDTYEVRSPTVSGVVVDVADCSVDDALAAAQAAAAAQAGWAATPAMQRAAGVRALGAGITENRAEFIDLIVFESGKARKYAAAEVDFCLRVLETLLASIAELASASRIDYMTGRRVATVLRPAGPALLMTPWNFPLNLGVRKLASALLAGCIAVWKPSEKTPLSALRVAQVLAKSGLPDGVLSVVPTSRSHEITAALLRSGLIRKVSFTGSTPVGKQVMALAAERVTRVSLELGGNGPAIVGQHADLDTAVRAVLAAKFANSGQVCTAVNRAYVHSAVHDEFAVAVRAACDDLVVGPPDDDRTDVGPLITPEAAQRVREAVDFFRSQGAEVTEHGGSFDEDAFVPPTVITSVDHATVLGCGELFGPVLPIVAFEPGDDPVALANDTPFGLSAYAFSRDTVELDGYLQGLRAGMIAINSAAPSAVTSPFGGIGASGFGRENGTRGLAEFLDEITLVY